MSFNTQGAVEVPLSTFGSLVTEMSPPDLPEGVSPDNQDVVYAPGGVSSRPGLQKIFGTPFAAGGPAGLVPTVTYAKSYVTPTGDIKNLFLDSNGVLWVEDFSNTPGVYTKLFTSTPGSYAKSVTAFGREYIAISDGLHGQEVPLQYDGTFLDRVTQDGPGAPPSIANLILPASTLTALSRGSNIVTATTSGAHGLEAGYQAQISGVAANSVGGGIASVVINNESAPGLATVTTNAAHGLVPGTFVSLTGIQGAAIGSGIASISRAGEVVTVNTNAAHNLAPGATVTVNAGGNPTLSGTFVVTAVPSAASFTYVQAGSDASSASGAVGGGISSLSRTSNVVTLATFNANGIGVGAVITVSGVSDSSFNGTFVVSSITNTTTFTYSQNAANASINNSGTLSVTASVTLDWPVPSTSTTPTYFEVVAAPSSTTFQVEVSYADGSWTGGTVSYSWNGTFYVSSVPSATAFTYQQYGPDASAGSFGAVTPYGQASPGVHQMQVLFLTRQGAITRPSPPVTFVANGGQYLQVSNIPAGPANVVARILAFTGAQGAYFFYIPVPAQVNGQVVSTSTQVNDNTTSSVVLDFSDNTLFASIGISTPGNNLANQIVLDSALGFGYYADRLVAYGQRNRIQNLLNLSFDGGSLPSAPNVPAGWTAEDSAGALVAGRWGGVWQISVSPGGNRGLLRQSFYQDAYGAPIGVANTAYRLRCWIRISAPAPDVTFVVAIQSASGSFSDAAFISGSAMSTSGGWVEAAFQAPFVSIPSDTVLRIYATSVSSTVTLTVDELSIVYADKPYLDTILYGSYVNNPEGFDGVTGQFGPSSDTHKILDCSELRETLYLFTQEPSGRVHETANNGVTEPAGWQVSEVGSNCGVLSTFCLTKSQADDSSAAGGEEWMAWASASGARIFGGDQPWKISQEIQPDWQSINPLSQLTVWALNDPVARVIYFGLPLGGTNMAPNLIYPVSYRELDTPYQIAMSPPVHTSFSGKLIATDNTRKWTRWNIPANGAALLYRSAGQLSPVFFGGNGQTPGAAAGFGNVYTLDRTKLSDDDYGQINGYWTTYFFVNHEAEMALQLGAHRKMLSYLTAFISGVGDVTITPLINNLANPWPLTCVRALTLSPNFDLEWAGGSATGQRIAFKIASSPLAGTTDNSFTLQKLVATLKPATHLPIRGAAV